MVEDLREIWYAATGLNVSGILLHSLRGNSLNKKRLKTNVLRKAATWNTEEMEGYCYNKSPENVSSEVDWIVLRPCQMFGFRINGDKLSVSSSAERSWEFYIVYAEEGMCLSRNIIKKVACSNQGIAWKPLSRAALSVVPSHFRLF
jgi:hypothetical protein